MRLRQVVLAASDLDRVERQFADAFGWRVCFRDPIVAKWGLRNALVPIGNCFIEVVSPTLPDTSAGRHMRRIGGDGGYMVMVQVDDCAGETARLKAMGARPVYQSDQQTYCLTQFHPADCGGLMLSWEQVLHPAGNDWRLPDGYWHAAEGEHWRGFVETGKVGAMRRVVLAGPDGDALARLYERILQKPVERDGEEWLIRLGDPSLGPDIGFLSGSAPGPIARIDVEAVTLRRDQEMLIGGVSFRTV